MNPFTAIKYVPLSVLRAAAQAVAIVAIHAPNLSLKRNIDINLCLAYPQLDAKRREALMRQIIINQCLSGAESAKCWAMPPKWSVAQIHTVHNQQVLMQALDNPNGMLAIVPHIGTWEMMNAWINQFGNPTIMYKPLEGKWLNDFVLHGRAQLNATLVPTDSSGVKQVFKTLKQGGFSIVLPDHVPKPSGGINAPFFGISTLTSTLTPKLASKTKCALVGLSCVRREDNKGFDIYCTALNDSKLYSKDIKIATTALNEAIEEMVNRFTEHYTWGYKRFKKVPNIGNPYKVATSKLANFISEHIAPKSLHIVNQS